MRPELKYDVAEQVNINIKYEGYIKRQKKQVEQFKKLEKKRIPADINYEEVQSLRLEAKQKLSQIRPASIGRHPGYPGISGRYFGSAGVSGEQMREQESVWKINLNSN